VLDSPRTSGVAAIHSDLLRTSVLRDFADVFPERFNNKTNGATTRRWLQQANPALSKLITETIGDHWILDLLQLRKLQPLACGRCLLRALRRREAGVEGAIYQLAQVVTGRASILTRFSTVR